MSYINKTEAVGSGKLIAVRVVPIELLGKPGGATSAFLDLIAALAKGETRLCGNCDFVFSIEGEPAGAIVIITNGSETVAGALCLDCCDSDMRAAAEVAARRACSGDLRLLDPAHLHADGGRA